MKFNCLLIFDLRFKNKDIEGQYLMAKTKYQQPVLKFILLSGVLMGILRWSLNPFDRPIHKGPFLGFMIVLLVINIIAFMVAKKKPQYTENLMIFLILFYTIGLLENTHQNKEYWNNLMYFVSGMNVELILVTPLLSKACWIKSSVISFLINLLCCFRYTDLA